MENPSAESRMDAEIKSILDDAGAAPQAASGHGVREPLDRELRSIKETVVRMGSLAPPEHPDEPVLLHLANTSDVLSGLTRPLVVLLLRGLGAHAADQAGEFSALLREKGAVVYECPTISIVPPDDPGELDSALAGLDGFHWLILTSVNAVRFFFQRLAAAGLDSRSQLRAPATPGRACRFSLGRCGDV